MPSLVVPATHVEQATPRAAIVRLVVPEGEFVFRPGQAVTLGRHGQPSSKPYSIASAPDDLRRTGELEFLVGTGEDGRFDAHLAGLTAGGLVDLQGPLGSFGLPDEPCLRRVVFVAGGTGIAPLRSMWRHLGATRPDVQREVLYSARTRAHFAYEDELEELEAAGRLRLVLTTTREPAQPGAEGPGGQALRGIRLRPGSPILFGRIGASQLQASAGRGPAVYVLCGPPAFVAHVDRLLGDLGVAPQLIRKEGW